MIRDQAVQIVQGSIDALFESDALLLENDVSERAITHKLAEYLQRQIERLHIGGLNVDCEYNRNLANGPGAPKRITLLEHDRMCELDGRQNLSEDDFRSVTTFPDIIAHRRGTNENNVLIIEVKKTTSATSNQFDFKKLRAFTERTEQNTYRYEHGIFILLTTGRAHPPRPMLTWFSNGRDE